MTSDSSIIMCRRKLQCLDQLLGGNKAWVFHQRGEQPSDIRLILSTDVTTLADIWGPAWKVCDESAPNLIKQYNVGNGAIVPWNKTAPNSFAVEDDPGLLPSLDEVFCHWISSRNWDAEEVSIHQTHCPKGFSETDRLLIGAASGFYINKRCKPSADDLLRVKTIFLERHAIRPAGVLPPRRYVDSQTLQVQASILSVVTLTGGLNYKRQQVPQ
jgi:hypothetical protein